MPTFGSDCPNVLFLENDTGVMTGVKTRRKRSSETPSQRPLRPRLSPEKIAISTPDDSAAISPSLSSTTPALTQNEEYPSSPPTIRRPTKAPRSLRTLMPAPKTVRVTKPSTPTASHVKRSLMKWGYQMGKSPEPKLSSNPAPASSVPYMVAPTQQATSPYHPTSYIAAPYASNPPTMNSIQSRGVAPNANDYLPRDSRAVGPYPAMGIHTGQQDITTQPLAYNSYRYPPPIQAVGNYSATESHTPRQHPDWEYQMGTYPSQSSEYLGRQPSDRPSGGTTSPGTYSAASILTSLTSGRPDTTQCFLAQATGVDAYRNYNWGQQSQYVPVSHESYPRTSTAPNSSHFQISPPSRADTTEESLFVEENEDYEKTTDAVEDHNSFGGRHSAADRDVLESIEAASADGVQVDSNAKGKGKAADYGNYEMTQTRAKATDKRRALNEWVDYSSENLDY
ncbi:hypothetical protein F4818DRAFT_413572 [Hypoxylon cercidicola]|nr:hypothetical protein F4818DRAFT_413572 [Hypoxylon cercidicola]